MPRRLLLLAAVCALALSLAARAAKAADDVARLPLAQADIPAAAVRWYGLYLDGAKCGYVREENGIFGTGDAAVHFQSQDSRFKIIAMGKKITFEESERFEFDPTPPYAFRRARLVEAEDGKEEIVDVTRTATGFSARVTSGGEVRTIALPAIDLTLADATASERWLKGRPEVGAVLRARSFATKQMKLDVDTFTVESRTRTPSASGPSETSVVRHVSTLQPDVTIAKYDANGIALSLTMGGVYEARLEPEEEAKKIRFARDVFDLGTVKVDRPLGEATGLRRLVLEVEGEGAKAIVAGRRQTVTHDGTKVVLALGPLAASRQPAPTQAEIDDALAETVDYPTKLPVVVALARSAVGDAATPRAKVERLVAFVSRYLADAIVPESVPVPEIIRSKKGDCSEHARLFTALARAVGVPTREVSGLMYMGDDLKAFGGHAWAEVALDGEWIAVDPTWAQMELDASHVTLERVGESSAMATLGRIAFRLREVEPAPKAGAPPPPR